MKHRYRLITTCVLWGIAWTLQVVGTVVDRGGALFSWALFVALGACVAAGWWIVEDVVRRERIELEKLTEIVADVVREEDARPLRRV